MTYRDKYSVTMSNGTNLTVDGVGAEVLTETISEGKAFQAFTKGEMEELDILINVNEIILIEKI